jgi:hypothetical protein
MNDINTTSDELLASVARWERQLQEPCAIPSTLWFGIMQKCCHGLERLLKACLELLLPHIEETNPQIVMSIAQGKPPDRLTMGQRVSMLVALDNELTRRLRQDYPQFKIEARLIGRRTKSLLERISRARNDFEHARLDHDSHVERAMELLSLTQQLCQSEFVKTARRIEKSG